MQYIIYLNHYREEKVMKRYLLKFIGSMIFVIAVFSASTPSQIGTYAPKCPDKLKKFNFNE